jgi:phosphate-selective porin OprO/OprP
VIPHENFFCVKGEDGCINRGLGAWEVIFRVSYLDLDDEDFFVAAGGDSRTGGTGIMRDFTVGVNWYLNPNMKWMFNWVHSNRTSASGADFSGTVDSLIARFAMDF